MHGKRRIVYLLVSRVFIIRDKACIYIHLMGHLISLTVHAAHAAFGEELPPTMRALEPRRLRMIMVLAAHRDRLCITFLHK